MYKIVLLLLPLLLYAGCPVKTYIPKNAYPLVGTMYKEVKDVIPEYDNPPYFQALIEQESCVRLCGRGYWAKRCWSPISELHTKREQGIGFFQLTRTFKKNGRIRWDIIGTLRRKHAKELHELNWGNVKSRPDLQIKAGLLLWRDNYRRLGSVIPVSDRAYFADSMYNGGGLVYKERRICKLRKGCNPDKWFGNVELIKDVRDKKVLYGHKTAYDINREHVRNVFKLRLPKYKLLYKERIVACKDINGTHVMIRDRKNIN